MNRLQQGKRGKKAEPDMEIRHAELLQGKREKIVSWLPQGGAFSGSHHTKQPRQLGANTQGQGNRTSRAEDVT